MNQSLSGSHKIATAGKLYEVAHWIGGRIERGNADRHADIYNPALAGRRFTRAGVCVSAVGVR